MVVAELLNNRGPKAVLRYVTVGPVRMVAHFKILLARFRRAVGHATAIPGAACMIKYMHAACQKVLTRYKQRIIFLIHKVIPRVIHRPERKDSTIAAQSDAICGTISTRVQRSFNGKSTRSQPAEQSRAVNPLVRVRASSITTEPPNRPVTIRHEINNHAQ